MKTSWWAAASLTALATCLTGCDGGKESSLGTSAATVAPSASASPVVVTWQPQDKPAEFLSAWRRPKE